MLAQRVVHVVGNISTWKNWDDNLRPIISTFSKITSLLGTAGLVGKSIGETSHDNQTIEISSNIFSKIK